MCSITNVKGEITASQAIHLSKKAREASLERLAVPFLEAIFRDIREKAYSGAGYLRYEKPTLIPSIIEVISQHLGFCGFKTMALIGENLHPNANGSKVIGLMIVWKDYEMSTDEARLFQGNWPSPSISSF